MRVHNQQLILKALLLTILLLGNLTALLQPARADIDNPYWTPTSPLPGNLTLYNVYWDGAEFVAVGELGTILTSADGSTWTAQDAGLSVDLNDITKGGATYMAIGWGGVLLTSNDKVTWTAQSTGTNDRIRAIAYGGTRFVAVGDNGVALYSDDAGITWTSVDPDASGMPLLDVIWDGNRGQFIAVGGSSSRNTGLILTSADGITWTSQTVGTKILYAVASAGLTSYVAVGDSGKIYRSSNSSTWTAAASPAVNRRLNDIIYDGTEYVAVGGYTAADDSTHGIVEFSNDGGVGDSWTEAITSSSSGLDHILHAIGYDGAGTYVAIGTETVFTSGDADIWTAQSSGLTTDNVTGTAFDGTNYLAVTDGGDVYNSSDGFGWALLASPGHNFIDVTWDSANSWFAALVKSGSTYSLYKSATGNDTPWIKIIDVTLVQQLNALATNGAGTRYVITSDDGTMYRVNSDGSGINTYSAGINANFTGITWDGDNSVFLAVSDSGKVVTSANGSSWLSKTVVTVGSGSVMPALNDVAWSGEQYVAVGELHSFYRSNCLGCAPVDYASVLFSNDGARWEFQYGPNIAQELQGIVWNDSGKRFIAVGDAGSVIVSRGADLGVFMFDDAPDGTGTVDDNQNTTITVQNNGHFTATNVQLVVTLQNDAQYHYWAPGSFAGTTCDASTVAVDYKITCSLGTMKSTETATVTVGFAPTIVGTITTNAAVTSDEPEPLPSDNSTSVTTAVQSIADKIRKDSLNGSGRGGLDLPLLSIVALLLLARQLSSRQPKRLS